MDYTLKDIRGMKAGKPASSSEDYTLEDVRSVKPRDTLIPQAAVRNVGQLADSPQVPSILRVPAQIARTGADVINTLWETPGAIGEYITSPEEKYPKPKDEAIVESLNEGFNLYLTPGQYEASREETTNLFSPPSRIYTQAMKKATGLPEVGKKWETMQTAIEEGYDAQLMNLYDSIYKDVSGLSKERLADPKMRQELKRTAINNAKSQAWWNAVPRELKSGFMKSVTDFVEQSARFMYDPVFRAEMELPFRGAGMAAGKAVPALGKFLLTRRHKLVGLPEIVPEGQPMTGFTKRPGGVQEFFSMNSDDIWGRTPEEMPVGREEIPGDIARQAEIRQKFQIPEQFIEKPRFEPLAGEEMTAENIWNRWETAQRKELGQALQERQRAPAGPPQEASLAAPLKIRAQKLTERQFQETKGLILEYDDLVKQRQDAESILDIPERRKITDPINARLEEIKARVDTLHQMAEVPGGEPPLPAGDQGTLLGERPPVAPKMLPPAGIGKTAEGFTQTGPQGFQNRETPPYPGGLRREITPEVQNTVIGPRAIPQELPPLSFTAQHPPSVSMTGRGQLESYLSDAERVAGLRRKLDNYQKNLERIQATKTYQAGRPTPAMRQGIEKMRSGIEAAQAEIEGMRQKWYPEEAAQKKAPATPIEAKKTYQEAISGPLYHGSQQNLDAILTAGQLLPRAETGVKRNAGALGNGIYLTTDPLEARSYVSGISDKGGVVSTKFNKKPNLLYLDINSPEDLRLFKELREMGSNDPSAVTDSIKGQGFDGVAWRLRSPDDGIFKIVIYDKNFLGSAKEEYRGQSPFEQALPQIPKAQAEPVAAVPQAAPVEAAKVAPSPAMQARLDVVDELYGKTVTEEEFMRELGISETEIKANRREKNVAYVGPKEPLPEPAKPAEPAPPPAAAMQAGKEPWEMTKEEFSDSLNVRHREMIEKWNAEGNKGFPPGVKINTIAERIKLAEEAGYSLPKDASIINKMDYHRLSVEAAKNQNKPVPPEVLADYPDLAPKAEKPPSGPTVGVNFFGFGSAPEIPKGSGKWWVDAKTSEGAPKEAGKDTYRWAKEHEYRDVWEETRKDFPEINVLGVQITNSPETRAILRSYERIKQENYYNPLRIVERAGEKPLSETVYKQKPKWSLNWREVLGKRFSDAEQESMYRGINGKVDVTTLPAEQQFVIGEVQKFLKRTGAEALKDGILQELLPNYFPRRYKFFMLPKSRGAIEAEYKANRKILDETVQDLIDSGDYPNLAGKSPTQIIDHLKRKYEDYYQADKKKPLPDDLHDALERAKHDMYLSEALAKKGIGAAGKHLRKVMQTEPGGYTKERLNIPGPTRRFLGEYRELTVPLAEYIGEFKKDVALYKLHKAISEQPDWVIPDNAKMKRGSKEWYDIENKKPGYSEITAPEHSPLFGKLVKTEVAKDLNAMTKDWNTGSDFFNGAIKAFKHYVLEPWKYAKVPLNFPSAHIRDSIGRQAYYYMHGMDVADAGFKAKALREFMGKTGKYNEAYTNDAIPPSNMDFAEGQTLLKELEGKGGAVGVISKMLQKGGDAYQWGDAFDKYSFYKFLREKKGMDAYEAARKTRTVGGDYTRLGKEVNLLSYLIPFIKFPVTFGKSLARTATGMEGWVPAARMYGAVAVLKAANDVFQAMTGMDDEVLQAGRADYQKRMGKFVADITYPIIPIKDKYGQWYAWDLTNTVIGANFLAPSMFDTSLIPVASAWVFLRYGTDPLTGRQVYDPQTDPPAKIMRERVKYLTRFLTPSPLPGGYTYEAYKAAKEGTADYFGRTMDPNIAALRFIGIKLVPINPKVEIPRKLLALGIQVQKYNHKFTSAMRRKAGLENVGSPQQVQEAQREADEALKQSRDFQRQQQELLKFAERKNIDLMRPYQGLPEVKPPQLAPVEQGEYTDLTDIAIPTR